MIGDGAVGSDGLGQWVVEVTIVGNGVVVVRGNAVVVVGSVPVLVV